MIHPYHLKVTRKKSPNPIPAKTIKTATMKQRAWQKSLVRAGSFTLTKSRSGMGSLGLLGTETTWVGIGTAISDLAFSFLSLKTTLVVDVSTQSFGFWRAGLVWTCKIRVQFNQSQMNQKMTKLTMIRSLLGGTSTTTSTCGLESKRWLSFFCWSKASSSVFGFKWYSGYSFLFKTKSKIDSSINTSKCQSVRRNVALDES